MDSYITSFEMEDADMKIHTNKDIDILNWLSSLEEWGGVTFHRVEY